MFGEIGSVHVNVKYKMSMYVCKYRNLLYNCIFFVCFCSAEDWWSSLTPSMFMKQIMVFKKALAFMLTNGLLETHNPGVKFLLEALKLLYKVSVLCFH